MAKSEFRKLQESKGGSYLITLPKSWVKAKNLEHGSNLHIMELENGGILMEPRDMPEKGMQTTLQLTDSIDGDILQEYLLGYDTITIESKDRVGSSDRERIRSMARRLIGLEIVEEAAHQITLQCLLSPSAMPVKNIVKRAYDVAAHMHEDAVNSFMQNDVELANNVVQRDEEVDRLYFLAVRQLRAAVRELSLASRIGLTPVECLDYRVIAGFVESIGDLAAGIAQEVVKKDPAIKFRESILKMIGRYSDQIYDLHRSAVGALFQHQAEAAKALLSRFRDIEQKRPNLSASIVKDEAQPNVPILLRVLADLEGIGKAGSDIASILAWLP